MSISLVPAAATREVQAVLRARSGAVVPLLVDRWNATPTDAELRLLDRATGPVIDVGCGPGRHVHELAARGTVAIGIDVSPDAVALARRRGSTVLQRSVFDRIPHEGRWRSALLVDGNIGIGGDAVALLTRLHRLLGGIGSVLAEVEGPGEPTVVETVRVERGDVVGPWFPWARVAVDGVDAIAERAGFVRTWTHEEEDRWFIQLTP